VRARLRWLYGAHIDFNARMVVLSESPQDYLDKGFTPDKQAAERDERLDRLEVRGGTFGLGGAEIPSGQHNDLNEAKRRAGQHAIQPQPAHRAIPCSRATPPRTPGRGRGPARASPT